jgi:multidrug transporter EmrE-like cation transporter
VTAAALLLVLGAAVLHAGWNALTKRAADPVVFLWWVGLLASALYAPIALVILFRDGFTAAAIPFVLGTIVLHALYFFALGRAYTTGDYSLVYPIARGLGVALVPIAALALWDERSPRWHARGHPGGERHLLPALAPERVDPGRLPGLRHRLGARHRRAHRVVLPARQGGRGAPAPLRLHLAHGDGLLRAAHAGRPRQARPDAPGVAHQPRDDRGRGPHEPDRVPARALRFSVFQDRLRGGGPRDVHRALRRHRQRVAREGGLGRRLAGAVVVLAGVACVAMAR